MNYNTQRTLIWITKFGNKLNNADGVINYTAIPPKLIQGVDARSFGTFSRNFPFIVWSLLGGDGYSRGCNSSKLIQELCLTGAVGSRRFRTDFLQELPTPGTGPHFDTSIPNNITGLVGKTAYLNCRVKNLGNRTVSNRNLLVLSMFGESGDLFVS